MRNHFQSLLILLLLLAHIRNMLHTGRLTYYPLSKLVVLLVNTRSFFLSCWHIECSSHPDWTADGCDTLELMMLAITLVNLFLPRMNLLEPIE